MFHLLSQLPPWANALTWSAASILAAYLIGQFMSRTICRRLSAWASQTTWQWDDLVIETLRQGIPLWSVLLGASLGAGFWHMPERLLATFARAISTLVWLSVTFLSARLAGRLIVLYGSRFQQAMPMTSLTQNVTQIVIVILGLLTILHGLGISIAPLLTALGVGGLAVALALQDTLSNLFSGFYLTMARQVRVGDYVRLESGEEGYVEDIGWRSTKIRQLPNTMVLVPNNKLGQTIITNYDLPSRDLAVTVEAGVEYASDLDRVERVTCEVARDVLRTVPGGVADFHPLVRYHTLGDYSIKFTVILRVKEFVDQYLVKHEFIKRLVTRYREEGIAIPFPTRTVLTQDAD